MPVTIWNSDYGFFGVTDTDLDGEDAWPEEMLFDTALPSSEAWSDDDGEDTLSESDTIIALELSIAPLELMGVPTAESSEVTIVLPISNPSCVMCNERFTTISALQKHFCSKHRNVLLQFECAMCGRTNVKAHPISTHVPKFKGRAPAPVPVKGTFCCSACDKTYATQSGLSQHKRHTHAALRNEERIAERSRVPAQKGRKPSIWTKEEEDKLAVLETKYSGQRCINALIAAELGSKTNIQVGEKRRLPRSRSAMSQSATPSVGDAEHLASLDDPDYLPVLVSGVGKCLPNLVDIYRCWSYN